MTKFFAEVTIYCFVDADNKEQAEENIRHRKLTPSSEYLEISEEEDSAVFKVKAVEWPESDS
jgi:hypothetical protein